MISCLACRYLEHHGLHRQAANYMYSVAHSDQDIDIGQRHEFLQRAVESTSRACELIPSTPCLLPVLMLTNGGAQAGDGENLAVYTDFLQEVRDELIVAGMWRI